MITLELVQTSLQDGDVAGNLSKAVAMIQNASDKSDVIIFPETFFTGFPTAENIAELSQPLNGEIVKTLEREAKAKGVAVLAGMCEVKEGQYYNSAVFIDPDKGLLATYRKTHMWLTDQGLFTPGDEFISFEWRGIRIGLLICFDIEFPESGRANGLLDVDLLLVVNGNMDPYGETHRTAIKARAQENQFYAAFVNRVGDDDYGHVFSGGSCVVDPFGVTLCEAGREEMVMRIEIDPLERHQFRENYNYLAERALTESYTVIEQDHISRIKTNRRDL